MGELESFGFRVSLFEGAVEGGHEDLGAAVIDLPEGGDRGFCTTRLELVAESEDFFAPCAEVAAESSFAGAEDDEIEVI